MMARLKLRGMHAVFDEVLTNGRKARWATERIMMELLRAEAAERHLRSIRYEEWLEEAKRKKLEKKLPAGWRIMFSDIEKYGRS